MPHTTYTPSLPGLSTTDDLDTVINWGLGADSTAYLARMLTDPAAHGIDLERTAVLYMATGSEWPETRLLCEEFMLPLLREHGVRFVQLARNGHLSLGVREPWCDVVVRLLVWGAATVLWGLWLCGGSL
ncbi:hypothetical protein [Streptomyces capitiformicae]|uniref:Uncharacterized protein n=1 Tax=Streptomyces capitiformicae TaxID=2014920 RepID=A0A918Z267_9ACTN|nr:hypothetical protein [Streptomyces capitiformicae]GHE34769.1 hypothetical protein GCM10017771_52550 [Streptomyces capitiformicae]